MTARKHPQTVVDVSDRALARVAAHVASTTPGVAALAARLGGRLQSLARGRTDTDLAAVTVTRDAETVLAVEIAVHLDLPPVRTCELVAQRVRDEILRVTGQPVEVRVLVTALG